MCFNISGCVFNGVNYLISLKSYMPKEAQIMLQYIQRVILLTHISHRHTVGVVDRIYRLSTDLFMDLLEEGDLLLQALDASLQVQPGQSGIVNILDTNTGPEYYNYR